MTYIEKACISYYTHSPPKICEECVMCVWSMNVKTYCRLNLPPTTVKLDQNGCESMIFLRKLLEMI